LEKKTSISKIYSLNLFGLFNSEDNLAGGRKIAQ
jgi:hypothetical protein